MVHDHIHPLLSLTLTLGVNVTQNIVGYHLYHVTYAPSKFEVAMSNGLGLQ